MMRRPSKAPINALFDDPAAAIAGLSLLDYLSDLFTGSPKESFPREDILIILREVRSDPELFDQEAALVFDELSREFEQEIFDATPK